jgi:phosphoserine phosphatase
MRFERDGLRSDCMKHGVPFVELKFVAGEDRLARVLRVISFFKEHTAEYNAVQLQSALSSALLNSTATASETYAVLLVDGDKTLCANDTAEGLWQLLDPASLNNTFPAKQTFKSMGGYSYSSFTQVNLLYETLPEAQFEAACTAVATTVVLHPQWLDFLNSVQTVQYFREHVAVVVFTAGVKRVWQKVLALHGLQHIAVIGGSRINDALIVDDSAKQSAVHYTKQLFAGTTAATNSSHSAVSVWAFGDSPVDMPMLVAADRGFVIVGDAQHRSTTMDTVLSSYIATTTDHNLQQMLLPDNVQQSECDIPVTTLHSVLMELEQLVCCVESAKYAINELSTGNAGNTHTSATCSLLDITLEWLLHQTCTCNVAACFIYVDSTSTNHTLSTQTLTAQHLARLLTACVHAYHPHHAAKQIQQVLICLLITTPMSQQLWC